MKRVTTLGILLFLTLLAALASSMQAQTTFVAPIIMGLAMIKLLLVAFQFMELKKAHKFWKTAVVAFSITFFVAICLLVSP